MPQQDYAAYCKTPHGIEARKRAQANYLAKRHEAKAVHVAWSFAPILQALKNWKTS